MLLERLRQEIDQVDRELVRLLNERARMSLLIFEEKQKQNLPIHNQQREEQVLQKAILKNKGPLTKEQVESIFQVIIESCRTIQRKQKGLEHGNSYEE